MDWGFLLQDETIGVVTWVGTILTIAGLVYTIVVAKGARAAADEAVRLIQGQHSLANIAFSYAQITLVKTLINSKNMTGAGIVFLSLKREIYGILSFLKDRHDLPGEIAIVKRNLVTIERQLDLPILDNGQDTRRLIKALTGIGNFLVEREQEMKSATGKSA